ncbi:HAD-IC family P-type ATPase [Candidatus Phytoplasma pini]|uniref:H+ transporting ATPase, P-type ATPase n=1 Tax=Candidatus Phytoplasma pini TaxID=267362 RepID=A0A559KJJ2_9MOLU|nr:HAD-IC family P-type ATPase [Candidatus Phytoplasma pini]TVY12303.1 H+ transporting ATPase, P-type ATPase [Candidatus Phytoplasma pini]
MNKKELNNKKKNNINGKLMIKKNPKEEFILNNIKGLTSEEVKIKLQNPNINQSNKNNIKSKTIKDIIFTNIFTFFNLLILIVAFIIIYIKCYEQLFFLFINFLNLTVNIVQEIRAKKILDKISLLTSNNSKVIRNGKIHILSVDDILVDDILLLELGSQIVVDARLMEGKLEVNEALLTGESKNVFKKEKDLLYSGSYVVSGYAYAKVIAIGSNVYISKLTQKAKKYQKIKTPLTIIFRTLIITIILLLLPLSFLLFLTMKTKLMTIDVYDNDNKEFILGFCCFILCVMPSGLFLLTSMTLAVGFIKLAKNKAYVRDLFGIEMLAQIDVLCLDKTGTITDGFMEVKEVIEYPDFKFLPKNFISAIVGVFPNNNSTQKALYDKFVSKSNNNKFYSIKKTRFFSSVNKYSAVEFETLGTFLLGAPEFILKKNFHDIKNDVDNKSQLGYRVLLLAQTDTKLEFIDENTKYKNIALIMIEDKIKEDVYKIIEDFKKNDVKIKIISGDDAETLTFIGKRIGILGESQKAINLTDLTNEEISYVVSKCDVFGRSTPEQKQYILKQLKENNYKVAMIGDGVNDILAFKEAHISIAMASGSKSTQNVANLVLMDSRFNSLIQVVAEGKRVVNNLKKISVLFLTKTISTFILAILVLVYNLFHLGKIKPFPLNPLKFNLIDNFFIGIPSFFLALEMNNKKIKPNFLKSILIESFPYALLIGFNYLCLLLFTKDLTNDDLSTLTTLTTALVFFNLLINNCIPFNKLKTILLIFMFWIFIVFGFVFSLKFLILKSHLKIFGFLFIINFIFVFFSKRKLKKFQK